MRVTMPDGSKWDVPVIKIAEHRAEHYKSEYSGNLQFSLIEDTIPLFESDEYEIEDWAANNMDWSDVVAFAKEVGSADDGLYQEGWVNGDKDFLD